MGKVRTLVVHPDERLRRKSKPVRRVDDEVRRLMDDMAETMYANRGIGLAAPQVGVNRRVIVVHAHQNEEEGTSRLLALANPRIVEKSAEAVVSEEGCLSVPGVREETVRAVTVTVEGLDPAGEEVSLTAHDLEARVIQHEVDHLDGILFVDYVDSLTRDALMKEYLERRSQVEPSKGGEESTLASATQ
jgi:peptide deformylase